MKICSDCKRCYDDNVQTCDSCGHDRLEFARYGKRLIDEKYRLDRLISLGGMGVVYKGTELVSSRPVAIKLLRLDNISADPKRLERFRREGNTGSLLQHPNVVETYAHGELGPQQAYIVMELLEGKTLRQYLKENKRPSVAETINILQQVAQGIDASHKEHILHRDLKPENIMLTRDPAGELLIKVLDFGLAKIKNPLVETEESSITEEGMFIGSFQYTSPENCRGYNLGNPSDIYSMGVIAYEMLAGQRPFNGSTLGTICYQHIYEMPQSLTIFRDDLPPELVSMIMQALNKNPESRQSSAEEFANQLRNIAHRLTASPSRTTEPHGRGFDEREAIESDPVLDLGFVEKSDERIKEASPKRGWQIMANQLDDYEKLHPKIGKAYRSTPPLIRRRFLQPLFQQPLPTKHKAVLLISGFLIAILIIWFISSSFSESESRQLEAHLNQGLLHLQMGEYDRAIEELDKAILLDAKSETAYLNRGIAYSKKGDYDRGISDFTQAIQLNAQLTAAYESRGLNYLLKNMNDRAITDFTAAIRLLPKSESYKNRGDAYFRLGAYDQAIVDYTDAIRLNPQYADAYSSRGDAYSKTGKRKPAKSDYSKADRIRAAMH